MSTIRPIAACAYTAANPAVITLQDGSILSAVRTGLGDVTVNRRTNFGTSWDAAQSIVLATARDTAVRMVAVERVNDDSIRVRAFGPADAATDTPVDLVIFRVLP